MDTEAGGPSETTADISGGQSINAGVSVGDVIRFGAYEQDNDPDNGKEPIEWRVLAKEGNRILVISEHSLDCSQYDPSYLSITWETCSLRDWLNGTFWNTAFNAAEQKYILSTSVTADMNPKYDTDPGNATTDKVFLLSINEVNQYFEDDEDRKCTPTVYAIENGASVINNFSRDNHDAYWWWLRSPGFLKGSISFVYKDGSVACNGIGDNSSGGCVRPALWTIWTLNVWSAVSLVRIFSFVGACCESSEERLTAGRCPLCFETGRFGSRDKHKGRSRDHW